MTSLLSRCCLSLLLSGAVGLTLGAVPAAAADPADPVVLILKDHRFQPETLTVAAGQRFTLVVKNQDPSGDEFESHDLKIEKRVGARQEIRLTVGPLAPGRYEFVAEQHEETAKGVLVAQ